MSGTEAFSKSLQMATAGTNNTRASQSLSNRTPTAPVQNARTTTAANTGTMSTNNGWLGHSSNHRSPAPIEEMIPFIHTPCVSLSLSNIASRRWINCASASCTISRSLRGLDGVARPNKPCAPISFGIVKGVMPTQSWDMVLEFLLYDALVKR